MVPFLKRFVTLAVAVIFALLLLARLMLDLIGYSTAPDDYDALRQKTPDWIQWLFQIPWWGIVLILSVPLVYLCICLWRLSKSGVIAAEYVTKANAAYDYMRHRQIIDHLEEGMAWLDHRIADMDKDWQNLCEQAAIKDELGSRAIPQDTAWKRIVSAWLRPFSDTDPANIKSFFGEEIDLSRAPTYEHNPGTPAPGEDRVTGDQEAILEFRRLASQYATNKSHFLRLRKRAEGEISQTKQSIKLGFYTL